MDYHRASQLADESRTISEKEFATRHSGSAFLIEPFEKSAARDLSSTTSKVPLRALAQPKPPIHESARVVWLKTAQGIIRLGRDTSCELVLPHASVSKRHAILTRTPTGWNVSDEGSRNGTTLNDRLLAHGESAPLSDGDAIGLSGVVLLRPFMNPGHLYSLLRGPEPPSASRPRVPTSHEGAERLATTFRALGLVAELEAGVLVVSGADAATRAHVRYEPGTLVVELERAGVRGERQVFPAEAEEKARACVLTALGFF